MDNEHRVQRTFYDSQLLKLLRQEYDKKALFKKVYTLLSSRPEILEFGKEINQPTGIYVKYKDEDEILDLPDLFNSINIKIVYIRNNSTSYYYNLII